MKKKDYFLEGNNFVIENYDNQKPFASFLPGIAGRNGIPIWAYYTNRGQGIAGFGVENKDGAILDFVPANKAYKRTETEGFRTFIKKDNEVHEIFSSNTRDDVSRRMKIEVNAVSFTEENMTLGLKICVRYFTVTDEKYPGLVRNVRVTPLPGFSGDVQMLDGLMTLWPYGNSDFAIKSMSNLSVAWFESYMTENNIPFFRNRSTTSDSAEVGTIEAGHFLAAFTNKQTGIMPIIYDPEIIFGFNSAHTRAAEFEKNDLVQLLGKKQYSENKIPCAYAAYEGPVGEELVISSIIGRMNSIGILQKSAGNFSMSYIRDLESRAQRLGEELTSPVNGKTAFPEFDAYVMQSFMDNLLRGGYPLVFEGLNGSMVYHIYSRIHGDMEREYNYFVVEPAYFSQGIGSFRDVNQNRRNDVYFVKEAGLFNIMLFMELIQMDGQNPLSVQGSKFRVAKEDVPMLLDYLSDGKERVENLLNDEFTPGMLLRTMDDYDLKLTIDSDEFLNRVMERSEQVVKASFGHGYWMDHWTYNMDLVDNYLNIYPDGFNDLMFEREFRYFVSPVRVLPRADKYIINKVGKVRQYDAVIKDEERIHKLGIEPGATNWHKTIDGKVLKTSLYVKLLTLLLNKIANLDQSGIGIMMNTDKPGWNDSMNGLPGLFGSGTSETIELKRIVNILLKASEKEAAVLIPRELYDFYSGYKVILAKNLEGKFDDLEMFENAQGLKEDFDAMISKEISGAGVTLDVSSFKGFLCNAGRKIDEAVGKALELGNGIPSSYIVHDAVDFQIIDGKHHPVNGMQNVIVHKWKSRVLPLYLEAPARYLKHLNDAEKARALYEKVLDSGLYDQKLKMYLTSESLEEETFEIGRARAFSAGWLERESVFMHMEYKYLIGMLKGGLINEFFEAIKTALPPFMNPAVYGRSTLENSSFIASSRNPDPSNHGRGFVSRLTGTTAEMISIWLLMMMGPKIFSMDDGRLVFRLRPVLPSSFFDENNEVMCRIFERTKIIYKNPGRKNTFGANAVCVKRYILHFYDGTTRTLEEVTGEDAMRIRNGEIKIIEAELL